MSDSILTSTKAMLGIHESVEDFDLEIMNNINTALTNLNDIGIGPAEGYEISDDTPTWDAFIGTDPRMNSVKNYVWLYTKLAFDPPDRSFVIAAHEKQLEEALGRLSNRREFNDWVDPIVPEEDEE